MSIKIIRTILLLVLCAFFIAACDDNGGENSRDTAINIDAEAFRNLLMTETNNCADDYTLTDDYIVTGEWTGLCAYDSASGIDGYKGLFNGDGHTIRFKDNMKGGFFAYVNANTVQNLNIVAEKDVIGIKADTSDNIYAGGIAGLVTSSGMTGLIDNCSAYIKGNVIAEASGSDRVYAGGLGGLSVTISSSYAVVAGSVTAKTSGTDIVFSGGLAGLTSGISRSYAIVYGSVSNETNGTTNALSGGLAGQVLYIMISYAVVNESVISDGLAGGLAAMHNGVTDNVAIVKELNGNSAGQIFVPGFSWGSNNYAFNGGNDATSSDGQKVTAADLTLASWWGGSANFSEAFTLSNGWVTADGYFPIQQYFKNLGHTALKISDFSWVKDSAK